MIHTIVQLVLSPVSPFVWHPERALAMAVGFVILFAISALRSGKLKPQIHLFMLLAAVGWVLFSLNEVQAKQNGWNIRVDLLVIWPVLCVVSLAAAWLGVNDIVAESGE